MDEHMDPILFLEAEWGGHEGIAIGLSLCEGILDREDG